MQPVDKTYPSARIFELWTTISLVGGVGLGNDTGKCHAHVRLKIHSLQMSKKQYLTIKLWTQIFSNMIDENELQWNLY